MQTSDALYIDSRPVFVVSIKKWKMENSSTKFIIQMVKILLISYADASFLAMFCNRLNMLCYEHISTNVRLQRLNITSLPLNSFMTYYLFLSDLYMLEGFKYWVSTYSAKIYIYNLFYIIYLLLHEICNIFKGYILLSFMVVLDA